MRFFREILIRVQLLRENRCNLLLIKFADSTKTTKLGTIKNLARFSNDREMEGMREPPIAVPQGCSGSTEGGFRGWGRARPGYNLKRERATASLPLVMGW